MGLGGVRIPRLSKHYSNTSYVTLTPTMSSTQQLLQTIDTLKVNGHTKVTVTVLPSQIKRQRKSVL